MVQSKQCCRSGLILARCGSDFLNRSDSIPVHYKFSANILQEEIFCYKIVYEACLRSEKLTYIYFIILIKLAYTKVLKNISIFVAEDPDPQHCFNRDEYNKYLQRQFLHEFTILPQQVQGIIPNFFFL
jgi:hypothetical protein